MGALAKMFTSALPVRAWRGGVSASGSQGLSATQKLTDAGAPPPGASGGRQVWPKRSSKAGALGTSEADARRTRLQACGRREALTEGQRRSEVPTVKAKSDGSSTLEEELRGGGMSVDLCLPNEPSGALESTEQKGGMSIDRCPSEGTSLGGTVSSERVTPLKQKGLSRKRWQKLSRSRRPEAMRKSKRADLPVKRNSTVDRNDSQSLDTWAVKELIEGVYSETARKSAQARID